MTQSAAAPTIWDAALDAVVARLAAIRQAHGPQAVGFVSSGHCTNEEHYLLQKLARRGLGTNNVDTASQLCFGPTVRVLRRTLGIAAATTSYAQIEAAGCLLVVGSNISETQPIVGLRVKAAVRNGAKLVLIDPRAVEIQRFAYLWLRPRPGSDLALVLGVLRAILDEGLQNDAFLRERCAGADALLASLNGWSVDRAAQTSGVPAADIVATARLFASGGRDARYSFPASWIGPIVRPGRAPGSDGATILYGTGVTQRPDGELLVQALLTLVLATGQIGRPGAGIVPATGHANSQGGYDVGCAPDLLPGQAALDNLEARDRLDRLWGAPPPREPGLNLLEQVRAAYEGRLKALYIVGANPLVALPDPAFTRAALERLDLLVVQDIFPSETAALAHVVLPACSVAETRGTFTNLERCVQVVRPAVTPVGGSRPDWWILGEMLRRLVDPTRPALDPAAPVPTDPLSGRPVFAELCEAVPFYRHLREERLGTAGQQWSLDGAGGELLHAVRFATPDGRARLLPVPPPPDGPPVLPDLPADFPLLLCTGRSLYHFNTGVVSRRAKGLETFQPQAVAEVHPADAAACGLQDGDLARLISPWGEVRAPVKLSEALFIGQVFAPFHYAEVPVNALLPYPASDLPGLPPLKHIPVRLERAE
ncbi:MAG: molybdopterin-dependent oxidoreductase [Chloroflexi bacterium]|nr:molybdopterin-dependent oxidoreductase [Chloroflexota bacterium]